MSPEPMVVDDDLRESLLEAAERLDGLAKRLTRKEDFLSEWTVRSIAWELTMLASRIDEDHDGDHRRHRPSCADEVSSGDPAELPRALSPRP